MMSAIILAEDKSIGRESRLRAVARSLSALVALVVGDVVADAVVVAHDDMDLTSVEQRAGCKSETASDLRTALVQASTQVRRDRVLLLRAGFAPDGPFADEIVRAIELDPPGCIRTLRAEPATSLQRVAPRLAPIVAIVASRFDIAERLPGGAINVARVARSWSGHSMRACAIRV